LRSYFPKSNTNSINISVGASLSADLNLSVASIPAGNTAVTLAINSDGLRAYIPNTALDGFYWKLTGNSGTTAGTNFVGTTDTVDLVFKANGNEVFRAYNTNKNVLIGTASDQGYRGVVFSDSTVLNGLIVKGGNLLAANFAAKFQNSDAVDIFLIQNDTRSAFFTTPTANATLTIRNFSTTTTHKAISFKDGGGIERGYITAAGSATTTILLGLGSIHDAHQENVLLAIMWLPQLDMIERSIKGSSL